MRGRHEAIGISLQTSFIKIRWFIVEIWRFYDLQYGGRPLSWILKIFILGHVTVTEFKKWISAILNFKGPIRGVRVWTLAIAPLTWVRLVTSSALQSRKWQLIGMSQWCRSALCGHALPALTDNWTRGAASRHTIAAISHTRPSPRSRSYYSFPIPLRVGGWVGLSTQ